MGLDLKPLVLRERTNLESFASKVIAIDAYNAIYQFLHYFRVRANPSLTGFSSTRLLSSKPRLDKKFSIVISSESTYFLPPNSIETTFLEMVSN